MRDRRARRRTHAAPVVSHERWLVSYADFITLLFAFFTTMYAISTVDARKLSSMVDSVHVAFDSTGMPVPAAQAAPRQAAAGSRPTAPTTEQRDRALAQALRTRLGGSPVDVTVDHRGVVVSIDEAGSFATGRADLSVVARDVLTKVAATVGTDPLATMRVEGHTDDVPIQGGRYASNWELSTARATAVVSHLVLEAGVAPRRLSAAGYGEFHPRVGNTTDANRARNRRVDIVILNDVTAVAEEPGRPRGNATTAPASPSTLPSGRVFAG